MTAHNSEIAAIFDRLADLLEIEGANPFRIRAYREAARTIAGQSRSFADLVAEEADLSKLPHIGKAIAEKIKIIVETGRLPQLEDVASRTPAALSDLMKVEGLGPKRVKILYQTLNIRSEEDLARAVRTGQLRELPGFGKKTEDMIGARLAHRVGMEPRTSLRVAEQVAEPLTTYLKKTEGVKQIAVAGSYRRRKETVGDLDILVTAQKDSPAMQRFVDYEEVEHVISKGPTRSTVRLRCGMQVDLRVVPQVSYGAAMEYFTGSKAHNVAIRKLGVKKRLKINEYGVFRGEQRVAGRTEREIYAAVGLPYIEPELREDRGEIDAARKHELPKLVTVKQIRGDLHCHTKTTDGNHTVEQMARAAKARGYQYLAISDHTQHVTVAHGMDAKRLLRQIRKIDRLNEELDDIEILKSVEVDILENGALDLPDDILAQLDFTVCAVHYRFGLSRKKQTERIIRAMDNPYFTILAHPTGRLIGRREPYELDLERVMEAAKDRGCHLELNAQPDRLDLDDSACKMAKDLGVKIAISTDAHSTEQLDLMRFGVDQARRGWVERADVLNTRSLRSLRKLFER